MTLRVTWRRAALALVAAAALALLVGWSGAVNVAASSGHWKVTEWFLHWVMRNSVKTRSALEIDDPAADPGGSISAAGHYAAACAICHGAPGVRPSPVMRAATPPAPDLAINARQWTDRQLHWILKHGVKYSGMPAWPAPTREDEVRRMVSFVRRIPGMTPAAYRQLTGGVASLAGSDRFESCVGCHGPDGRGRGADDIPVLGGQNADDLYTALRAYASGARASAVMQNAVTRLGEAEMRAYAARFAAMPGLGTAPSRADPLALRVIERGLPDADLPACVSCHRPGKPYPVLAGQKPSYVAARLRRWRGDPKVVEARKDRATMPVIARRIPEDLIDRIAAAFGPVSR